MPARPILLAVLLLALAGPCAGPSAADEAQPTQAAALAASAAAPAQIFVRPYFLATFAKRVRASRSRRPTTRRRASARSWISIKLNTVARALGISGTVLSATDR